MTDYKIYINALRQCAREHKNDSTPFAHIIVSDLCCDVANLLERLEQEPCEDCVSRQELLKIFGNRFMELQKLKHINGNESLKDEQLGVNWCTNTLKELPFVNTNAIKALEQEPCEDCVSREELKKWLDMNFSFGGALRKLELFDRLDKELPFVNPTSNLDKIRAEIDIARFIDKDTKLCKNANASGLEVALQIIDKYKEK